MQISDQQCLCLAACAHCCILVHRLAKTGTTDENQLSRLCATTLVMDTVDPEDLYGGAAMVKSGVEFIVRAFGGRLDPDSVEVLRMANSALQLQSRLRSDQTMESQLGYRLEHLPGEAFNLPLDSSAYERLNEIYVDTVSRLQPSIVVRGAEGHLQNPAVVAKVRSALLAAVRAAYFWYETGGRRWHFLFWRKAYAETAKRMLQA